MGANEFQESHSGITAADAFHVLVQEARYLYGHAGDTGTIAEKETFRMETPRAGETPEQCVIRCAADFDHWSGDKWGPAACVDGGPDSEQPGHRVFHFFGWAPS